MRQMNPDLPALRDTPPDACVQTMTGSRFPGSRVVAFNHLPGINRSQWYQMVVGSPLTVAGAAAALPVEQAHRIPLVSPCGHYREQASHSLHAGVKAVVRRDCVVTAQTRPHRCALIFSNASLQVIWG
jgi:hypothetical protein